MRLALMGLLMLCLPLAAQMQVSELTETSLKLQIDASKITLENRGDWSVLTGAAMRPDEPGLPDLPYYEALVAVPPGGWATASIQQQSAVTEKLAAPLRPVAKALEPSPEGVDRVEYRRSADYDARAQVPLVETLPAIQWRDYTLVPIRVRPFAYDPSTQTLTRHDNLTVNVAIHGDVSVRNTPDTGMQQAAQSAILNWDMASGWRDPSRIEVNYADFNAWPAWVKIEVATDGMYVLKYGDLSGKLDLSLIDPAEFRLFSTGGAVFNTSPNSPGSPFAEVPILVEDGGDGQFNSGDRIIFYGRSRDGEGRSDGASSNLDFNPYSQNTCYWLTYGAGDTAPLRIATTPTQNHDTTRQDEEEVVLLEEENYRREDYGFDWFMTYMQYLGSLTSTYNYSFSTQDVIDNQQQWFTITLQEEYYEGDPRHHNVQVSLNGQPIVNENWSGTAYKTIHEQGDFVSNGTNNITVTINRSSGYNMLLDYIRLTFQRQLRKHSDASSFQVRDADDADVVRYIYADGYSNDIRAYVIHDFDNVNRATITPNGDSFSFTAQSEADSWVWVVDDNDYRSPASIRSVQPTDLTLPSIGAQAIIIAPEEFIDEANELAATYQSAYGLQTFVCDLDDVFQQFSGGSPDPAAIRGLVRWVYGSDESRPLTYLTLLGAGVFDWRNFGNASTGKDRIIVWQVSYTSSDDYFGYVNSDLAPVVGIGRYPAWNNSDLRNQMDHTIDRIEDPERGWWTNRLLFLADDQHNSGQHNQIDHTENAQINSEAISPSVIVDKIMAIEYDLDAFQNKPQVRDLMIDEINKGALIWFYSGHGGPTKIGDEDYFTTSDVNRLENGNRKMPLFIAASCSVGKYDLWNIRSLAETVVTQKNSGCIGSMGASCSTFAGNNLSFFNNFFDEVVNNRLDMGQGLVAAKLRTNSSVRRKYIYFGDPVLQIVPPAYEETTEINTVGDSVIALRSTDFEGQFDTSDSGEAIVRVFDAEIDRSFECDPNNIADWTERGRIMYRGLVSVENGAFEGAFIAPYDIEGGHDGRIICLYEGGDADIISYRSPLRVAASDEVTPNPDTPHIEMWLDSKAFIEGDPVGSSPLLIAALADTNSINMLGKPGHKILARVMSDDDFTDVTNNFVFNLDSHTAGELTWKLEGLSAGPDSLELIAFDSQNRAAVAHLGFTVSGDGEGGGIAIEKMLPYPNPLNGNDDFYFTFILTDAADVTLDIYTITGRKIETLKLPAAGAGYHQIPWDGRDADGDKVANNTYFYRVRAKGLDGGDAEEIGKVMVLR